MITTKFFYFHFFSILVSSFCLTDFTTGLCSDDQKNLLLEFRGEFVPDPYSSVMTVWWNRTGEDCCSWFGVECDAEEGHVISLQLHNEVILREIDDSSALFNFTHLQRLTLAQNDFGASKIPNAIGKLTDLRYLNLSNSNFAGHFPDSIFQIPSLEYLDVSYNDNLVGTLPQFSHAGSFRTIVVTRTMFTGSLRHFISNNQMLSKIDMSFCQFTGALPLELATLTNLYYLDLSFNSFFGALPSLIMLKSLTHLDLSNNTLTGSLSSLDLHPNSSIEYLKLRNNALNRSIPQSIFGFPSLVTLILSYNNFSGPLDEFQVPHYSRMELLDLESNKLEGPVPESLFKLASLRFISLSGNLFDGTFSLGKFQSFVVSLDLSDNNWSVDLSNVNSSAPVFSQLNTLRLESCKLYRFPDLRNQSQLSYLGLGHNHITGKIPSWIWEVGGGNLRYLSLSNNFLVWIWEVGGGNLRYLSLSNNFLVDIERPYNISPLLETIDLHSNQIEGHLSYIPLSVYYMDFSDNNLESFSLLLPTENVTTDQAAFLSLADNMIRGAIPTAICDAKYLSILDLSNNKLSGNIPPCLFENLESLKALILEGNNATGNIPDTFPRNCSLERLELRKNKLVGTLPLSLANCMSLEVVNIGDNKIEDTFPCMLPSNLRILVLRFNKFHGELRCPKGWPNLQILDIAHNNFSGYLSSTNLSEWSGTVSDLPGMTARRIGLVFWSNLYYEHALKITFKGQELELTKILTIYTSMDFSCNNFQGKIPEILGGIKSLYVLNLSHNSFTGTIPKSFSNLTNLGSLDLSMNLLAGEIPKELARLTFLSVLNVSYNKLVGEIPKGPQIQTFPASFFQGNMGLCGFPLNRSCSNNNKNGTIHEAEVKSGNNVEIEGAYISAALGFGVGFGSIIWLLFGYESTRLRFSQSLNKFFEHSINRLGRMRGQKRRVHREILSGGSCSNDVICYSNILTK